MMRTIKSAYTHQLHFKRGVEGVELQGKVLKRKEGVTHPKIFPTICFSGDRSPPSSTPWVCPLLTVLKSLRSSGNKSEDLNAPFIVPFDSGAKERDKPTNLFSSEIMVCDARTCEDAFCDAGGTRYSRARRKYARMSEDALAGYPK